MPREQVYTILEAYFSWYKSDSVWFTDKKKKTSFHNEKPKFWVVVDKNHYMGKFFSKISKEMEFFYPFKSC